MNIPNRRDVSNRYPKKLIDKVVSQAVEKLYFRITSPYIVNNYREMPKVKLGEPK
jgi:hypothetical protein